MDPLLLTIALVGLPVFYSLGFAGCVAEALGAVAIKERYEASIPKV